MKKLAGVLALFSLSPLTVLAHPGHDYYVEHRWLDFISQDSFIVFVLVLLGLLFSLIRMSLVKSPTSVNSDKTK